MVDTAGSRKISIQLTSDEALVLYDWLTRFNNNAKAKFDDQAEQRVLWDLEALLEKTLVEPFGDEYNELLSRARTNVRDSDQ